MCGDYERDTSIKTSILIDQSINQSSESNSAHHALSLPTYVPPLLSRSPRADERGEVEEGADSDDDDDEVDEGAASSICSCRSAMRSILLLSFLMIALDFESVSVSSSLSISTSMGAERATTYQDHDRDMRAHAYIY